MRRRTREGHQSETSDHLLLYQEARQPIKVENKILAVRVDVLDDGVHASELRGLLERHDPLGQGLAVITAFQAFEGCTMARRLFEEASLNVLRYHAYVAPLSARGARPSGSRDNLTHGHSVLNATRDDNICMGGQLLANEVRRQHGSTETLPRDFPDGAFRMRTGHVLLGHDELHKELISNAYSCGRGAGSPSRSWA